MKSLVTGGAGFLGSHIVDQLVEMGHQVLVFDDLSGGSKENINPKATFLEGSLNDEKHLKEIFDQHQIDFIYHLAAYAAENLSHFVRNFNYQNNVLGSVNLINEAIKHEVKCFVFTSSIAVYRRNTLPFHEEDTPLPVDPYGIAKYAVELDLQAAHEMFGLDYIVFRPHNVYGERQNLSDPYRNVIGIFMNQILNGKPLTIFGDGHQTRAFTYVRDIASHIASSVDLPKAYNQVFNIGADHTFTVKEIAEKVLSEMASNQPIKYLKARNEVQHVHSDHHKFKTLFHINGAETPLDIGLAQMTEWAKSQNPAAVERLAKLEITKNLPENWNT